MRTPRPAGMWLVIAVLLVLLAAAGTAGAQTVPAADVFAGVLDAEGDVTLGEGAFWLSPDIQPVTAAYLDNQVGRSDDDTVQSTVVVDAAPSAGVDPRIFSKKVLAWWLDTDGNASSGYSRPGFGQGADHMVVVFGTSNGRPTTAQLRRWGDNEFDAATGRTIPVVATGTTYAWSLPASLLRTGRGTTIRMWVEATAIDDDGDPVSPDRAPDGDRPLLIPVPPPPPTARTGDVVEPGALSATVSGVVNPSGATGQWFFRYGIDSVGESATIPAAVDGSSAVPVTATLTGLLPGVTYRYQLVARTTWGEAVGEVRTFTTATTGVTAGWPAVTDAARDARPGAVTLAGTVSVTGHAAVWWFEWGPTATYGSRSPSRTLVADVQPRRVTHRLAGLRPGSVQHYRLVVETRGQRYVGDDVVVRVPALGTLAITGRVAGSCARSGCRLRRMSVHVRARDARGRPLRGEALRRGLRARARCVSGCVFGSRAVRLSGRGTVLQGDVARLLPPVALRPGAVVEVRVERAGFVGAAYRATVSRTRVLARSCALDAVPAAGCATRR